MLMDLRQILLTIK